MGKRLNRLFTVLLFLFVALAAYYLGATHPPKESGSTNTLDFQAVEKKINEIQKVVDRSFLYDYENEELENGIYKGYVNSLKDIYTEYYTVQEYKDLEEQNQGAFGGVGIEVSAAKGQFIEVVSPIKGTPADQAGIKSGDRIIKIDGQEYTSDMLTDAVGVMRGEPGTDVTLTILRTVSGQDEQLDLTITRQIINIQSIHSQMLEDELGYIQITNFQANTAKQFFEAYQTLKDEGAKKMILDLRNNPGGLLDVTLEIADFLLPQGDIMHVKYKDDSTESYSTDAKMDDMPMVVLINQGSASASEILSGAIKDFERAEIIGENTFGKGVVQTIVPFSDGSGMKITMAEFYTPNHKQIHGIGIAPTKEVILDENTSAIGPENLDQDNQLQAAIDYLNK